MCVCVCVCMCACVSICVCACVCVLVRVCEYFVFVEELLPKRTRQRESLCVRAEAQENERARERRSEKAGRV